MDTTADLKLMGVALVDSQPLACAHCGNTFSLEVHKHLMFEAAAAWISCLACGHGEDSPTVTNGLVEAALAARLARQTDADRDTFTAEWRGTVMTGTLMPLLDIHQLIGAAKAVHEEAAPLVKRWWRSKKRQAKAHVKGAARSVTGTAKKTAGDAAYTAKAAALTAAWTMQTGGASPATSTRPKRRRCTVKGCRGGMLTIRTRIHSTSGKAQEIKVPCAVCRRAQAQ